MTSSLGQGVNGICEEGSRAVTSASESPSGSNRVAAPDSPWTESPLLIVLEESVCRDA